MTINPETLAQCRAINDGIQLWTGDVRADLEVAEQAIAEGRHADALPLAKRALDNALEMQEEQIEIGYEFEHSARQLIAQVQQEG